MDAEEVFDEIAQQALKK